MQFLLLLLFTNSSYILSVINNQNVSRGVLASLTYSLNCSLPLIMSDAAVLALFVEFWFLCHILWPPAMTFCTNVQMCYLVVVTNENCFNEVTYLMCRIFLLLLLFIWRLALFLPLFLSHFHLQQMYLYLCGLKLQTARHKRSFFIALLIIHKVLDCLLSLRKCRKLFFFFGGNPYNFIFY